MIDVSTKYLDWLYSTVCASGYESIAHNHRQLILQLHQTQFVVYNLKDQPREADGIDLRFRYCWDTGIDYKNYNEYSFSDLIPVDHCSILEMMIALAYRADENFTRKTNNESTVPNNFWDMVKNLGLMGETDDFYDYDTVCNTLDHFNKRTYEPNGHGSLFRFNNPKDDMREIDIWYQLCWYVNSKN